MAYADNPPGRREAILNLLRAAPRPRTILQLAEQLRVHPNTVRFHLEELRRTGQVEQVLADTAGPGRPPVLFRATRRMDPAGPTNYRLLATMLTSHLASSGPDPAATAAALGRAWAPRLVDTGVKEKRRATRVRRGEALTRMVSVLTDLGFAAEPPTGPRDPTIRLRHCPFLGLVADGLPGDRERDAAGGGHGALICSLHLGMMQGVLASLRGPVTVDRLEPFTEPDLCVAHLTPAPTGAGRRTGASGPRAAGARRAGR